MQSFEGSSTGESNADVSVIRELDAGLFPATAAVAHLIPRPLREEFAFGLDLLLRGLADETPGPKWRPAAIDPSGPAP